MEKKIKHLEMIQNIITRTSGNLFLLKGWAVTLIVALFTLVSKEFDSVYILFSFCILFIFWLLDGYFLSMERCYRSLYNDVRKEDEQDIDFSMDYRDFRKGRNTWPRSFFSKTLSIFYGSLLIVMIIIIVFNHVNIKINFSIESKSQANHATSTKIEKN